MCGGLVFVDEHKLVTGVGVKVADPNSVPNAARLFTTTPFQVTPPSVDLRMITDEWSDVFVTTDCRDLSVAVPIEIAQRKVEKSFSLSEVHLISFSPDGRGSQTANSPSEIK